MDLNLPPIGTHLEKKTEAAFCLALGRPQRLNLGRLKRKPLPQRNNRGRKEKKAGR
jgi:hypothetical protein